MSRLDHPLISDLQAVLLVGGKGTRLRSVVGDRPKALAEVAGRPFIDWLLLGLHDRGVRRALLCTGYLGYQIEDHLRTLSLDGLQIAYSLETAPLGTGGALRQALPLFASDPVLVLNGDSWCDADFERFLEWHVSAASTASLLLVHVSDTSRHGFVDVGATGEIRCFKEKDPAGQPGWINAGIYLLARSTIAAIEPNKAVSLEHHVFPKLISQGLRGFCTSGAFIDIGTPGSYEQSQQFFQQRGERLTTRPVAQ